MLQFLVLILIPGLFGSGGKYFYRKFDLSGEDKEKLTISGVQLFRSPCSFKLNNDFPWT